MKRIILICLFVLLVLVTALPAFSQDFATPTPEPTRDTSLDAVFNTLTPVGPLVIGTPAQPQDLVTKLDHHELTMLDKLSNCADHVNQTGEDCTSWQGQLVITVKQVLPHQALRISGDNSMMLLPFCPTDEARRGFVDIGKTPARYASPVAEAVAKLAQKGITAKCFLEGDLHQITGAFYNSEVLVNNSDQIFWVAIIHPHGGDISTFLPEWGKEPTSEGLTMLESLNVARVALPPQTVTQFTPTPVPNCSGSLYDMALSVNPNAKTVEELQAALNQFKGPGCDVLNSVLAIYDGKDLTYPIEGVYARFMNPAYTDLKPYVDQIMHPVAAQQPSATTVSATVTPTATMTPSG